MVHGIANSHALEYVLYGLDIGLSRDLVHTQAVMFASFAQCNHHSPFHLFFTLTSFTTLFK